MSPQPDAALFSLLAHLWLHEPDPGHIDRLHDAARAWQTAFDLHGTPSELATAYADLFLLNVPPYGTAYTDAWGEINTPASQQVATLYETHGYEPAELRAAGAPDHLGLCLGFLAYLDGSTRRAFAEGLLEWAPVCCLAAERDPSAHSFYRTLVQLTRAALFALGTTAADQQPQIGAGADAPGVNDGEVRLRDVTRFLLAPARCGYFLSRARLGACALALGMRLPFGSRQEVAEWLFSAAGENERVSELLSVLDAEAGAWEDAYQFWAGQAPPWKPAAALWLARVARTRRMLASMERQVRAGVPLELLHRADDKELTVGMSSEADLW